MTIDRRALLGGRRRRVARAACRAARRPSPTRRPRGTDSGEGDARVSGRSAGRDHALYAGARSAARLAARQPPGGMRVHAAGRLRRPEVGRITGRGNTANLEVVLALKPDLILDVGSTSPTFVSLATRVQEQTGIPYALLDGRFDATATTYRKLGELTRRRAGGRSARALCRTKP